MNMKRTIAATLLAASLLTGIIVPASAAPRTAVINVAYGITLEFNEQKASLTDAKGRKVEPFVSNGTTYVPIRAVSELFGASVDYDNDSNTAYIYDDFSEACALVFELSSAVAACKDVSDYQVSSVLSDRLDDTTYNFREASIRANIAINTVREIGEDNDNVSIIEQNIAPSYIQYLNAWNAFNNSYNALRANRTVANIKTLNEKFAVLEKCYHKTENAMTHFFDDYCAWRDINLSDFLFVE